MGLGLAYFKTNPNDEWPRHEMHGDLRRNRGEVPERSNPCQEGTWKSTQQSVGFHSDCSDSWLPIFWVSDLHKNLALGDFVQRVDEIQPLLLTQATKEVEQWHPWMMFVFQLTNMYIKWMKIIITVRLWTMNMFENSCVYFQTSSKHLWNHPSCT